MTARETAGPGRPTGARAMISLVLISFLALYLELALIRWIPGCIKVIGYYTNLVLISSFLGLGLGCAAPAGEETKPGLSSSLPFRLLLGILLYYLVQLMGLIPLPSFWGERLWNSGAPGLMPALLVPELVFIVNTWTFLPLGRELGRALSRFAPLTGYSLNLAGSIAGTAALTAFCAAGAPPLAWFLAAGLAWLAWTALEKMPRLKLTVPAALWALSLLTVSLSARGSIWSPYYKIHLATPEGLFKYFGWPERWVDRLGLVGLAVNDDYFQFMVNLDPVMLQMALKEMPGAEDRVWGTADCINAPYLTRPPGRVLILGAGLGNDVAAAIRNRSPAIDAVEIDPVIAGIGRRQHPERPYQDPRVQLHVTDARRFIKRARGPYDLIVYALLDSHTLFSAFSSVRLDTFVYTRESFQDSARLLSPDGVMVVMFAASRDFVGRRLFFLLHDRFPETARAWSWKGGLYGADFDVLAAGPGLQRYPHRLPPRFTDVTADFFKEPPPELPTDNWPFLYLSQRFITPGYAITLAVLLVIAGVFTRRALPEVKRIQPHFFLLGAGFLLLETKSITELSLLFGSTWMVNASVISAFLVMALAANLAAAKLRLSRPGWVYLALGGALLVCFLVPGRSLILADPRASALLGSGLVALPVFFSGLIFAASLRSFPDPAQALGSNILGAVAGGFLEYSSLILGFKGLYPIAALVYLLAYLYRKR